MPLSELSLCRSPTVHCAKNGCLRYPCADAPETDVRFIQAHCLHELSLASLLPLASWLLGSLEMTCTSFTYSLLGVLPMSTCHLAYRTSRPLLVHQVNLQNTLGPLNRFVGVTAPRLL